MFSCHAEYITFSFSFPVKIFFRIKKYILDNLLIKFLVKHAMRLTVLSGYSNKTFFGKNLKLSK